MGGYYAILNYERHEIREKVENKIIKSLKKSELICIIANAENLPKIEWERPAKEFKFEGNLYDIAYTENDCGINYYYCLSDKDETILKTKIDKFLDKQSENFPLGNQLKHILQFLLEPLLIHQNTAFCFKYFGKQNTSIFPNLTIFFTSNFVSKLKQPPQLS